jgi:uncharacterized protein with GYD domain
MPTYVVLCNLTEQGLQNAKEIPQRRDRARETAKELGITLREGLMTMGQYDVVLILEAPDDEAMAKFALRVGMRGSLRTHTLRAFTEAEVDALTASL